ncbi:hypothetical protein BKA70DRAFT_1562577 [Coprinopsis sp. MPI-PUGE-AT-0042]|nr:hypothetical protein BKA70DRAFT_1562577 [Coprinopsis sp. MPI-PUGE-AT-0042]
MEDCNPDIAVLGDVLYTHLIATRPAQSTFLAVLDAWHSTTLFGLKHHRTRSSKSLLIQPFWKIFERVADGGLVVTICRRHIFAMGRSLAETTVELLGKEHPSVTVLRLIGSLKGSTPAAGLRDFLDSVLVNHKLLPKSMKNKEKEYKPMGFDVKRREMHEMRRKAKRLMP